MFINHFKCSHNRSKYAMPSLLMTITAITHGRTMLILELHIILSTTWPNIYVSFWSKSACMRPAVEDVSVPDVFLLIFLSYLDVPSIWFQLVGGDLPQDLFVNGKEHLQTALFDVIIPVGGRGRRHYQLSINKNKILL